MRGCRSGAAQILEVAAERYGRESRPAAIILTHGHFDHVGALEPLLGVWDVPVYAHPLELPYLTGHADYPPPDPTVGQGLMARLSPLFPEKGIDLGDRVHALPENGDVPGNAGLALGAHAGAFARSRVARSRDQDRLLIAGDAITTTRPESVFSVLTQRQELGGPPAYFTIDWDKARRSVELLALLEADPRGIRPRAAAPRASTCRPTWRGSRASSTTAFARGGGATCNQPAVTDEQGVIVLPPPIRSGGVRWGMLSGVAATAFAGTWLLRRFGRAREVPQP